MFINYLFKEISDALTCMCRFKKIDRIPSNYLCAEYTGFVLLVVILLSSCTDKETFEESTNAMVILKSTAMTIPYKVMVVNAKKDTIQLILSDIFDEVNAVYNKWNSRSEISLLNNLKAFQKASLSPKLEEFFKITEKYVWVSGGRFDPTIESIQGIWREHLASGRTPSEKELQLPTLAVGWEKLIYKDHIFQKSNDNTRMDLSGIVKGFTVDLIAEKLIEIGIENFYVEWGGEIRAQGIHPDIRPWTVYISQLFDTNPAHAIDIIELNNEAIATSGDYLQQWSVSTSEGKLKSYSHIMNPYTLQPMETSYTSVASATVIAPTCLMADALATTALLFPNVLEAQLWALHVMSFQANIQFWIVSRETIAGF